MIWVVLRRDNTWAGRGEGGKVLKERAMRTGYSFTIKKKKYFSSIFYVQIPNSGVSNEQDRIGLFLCGAYIQEGGNQKGNEYIR